MPRSDLPFGSEFSPQQIDLADLLEIADQHGTDWNSFEEAVRDRYFAGHAASAPDSSTREYNRRKLANNTKLSMRAYGLVGEEDTVLTEIGRRLFGVRQDPDVLHEAFARHILTHLRGMTFVQCIMDMQASGETINLNTLRPALGNLGIAVPRGSRHMSTLRLWLEKAGVFSTGYLVNSARLDEILEVSADEFDSLSMLPREQRDYLKTLANMGGTGPYPSNEVERLAATTYGTTFNEKSLPKQVLYPLEESGYITLTRGTKETGRGAKPFLVTGTEKFKASVLVPLIEQIEAMANPDIRPLLRKSLADIREEIDSSDRHIRGLALEALAFKLMRLIDLEYVATRLRGAATGGAEVDVIFESARLVFSRWQVQCKNTRRVTLDDVAKEVGLTHMLKSNAIVMVTTGSVGGEARRYADTVMRDSNLCIIMVDDADLEAIDARPSAIVDVLNREARHAMDLKRLEG